MSKTVCIITCYREPDYVRAKALRRAVRQNPEYRTIVVKNSFTNMLRYPEVAWKVLVARLRFRPDVYLLTFRGYEMLPIIRLLSVGRPLIFDEFINLIEWAVYEHKKVRPGSWLAKVLQVVYGRLLRLAGLIMTDTQSHAEYSSALMHIPIERYAPLPVGTDEQVFKPGSKRPAAKRPFTVFFYGNMLPLHGIRVVLGAASAMKDKPVHFRIIGGDGKIEADIREAVGRGADIDYSPRVPFEQLGDEAARADVCLGGPFGGTLQAQMVITGKTYQFLAAGVPTVIGESRESHLFADKKDALIVKQNDAKDLVRALRWALDHKEKLPAIGMAGRRLFDEKFSTKAIEKQLSSYIVHISGS